MESVKGYVDHIIYRKEENGYTVFIMIVDREEVTCVGQFPAIDVGMMMEAQGDWVMHSSYGEQLKIESYTVLMPDDEIGIERYLGSGAIKGVGAALAARIVKKFGKETFRIMEKEPERLAEIKGISLNKAREIAIQVFEKREARSAMIFLQQYGIGNTIAIRIYEQYGNELYAILKENPYRLAEEVKGVGFHLADEIAAKAGIRTDSDYRIRCGLLYALTQAAQDGHCFLPAIRLLEQGSELLGLPMDALEPVLENLAIDRKVLLKREQDDVFVYSPTFYYAELGCAKLLSDIHRAGLESFLPSEQDAYERKLDRLEKEMELSLDELQRNAVLQSLRGGVMILSGGPGTGKTTTINAMIALFEQEGMDVMLAAPTGRAAKRMTEATGMESRTIHRLLEISGDISEESRGLHFERNEDNPLETDVLIIDEMSMVDLFLMQALLKAVQPGTRLILVGDVNQLPSVGPGQVLRDLIRSDCFPVVILQKIFRQAKESMIVTNAHRIYAGEGLVLDNKSRDFFFLERRDVGVIYKHMVQLILEKLPGYVHAEPMDIQVLTPMRKGPLGVETLNRILQQYLNPPSERKKEYQVGDTLYREGDKVMQIKNNYQLEWEILGRYNIRIDGGQGIYNGDTGRILTIDEYSRTVVIEYDENRRVTYTFAQLDEIEPAYAITIHKSQGSEYPAVILPLLSGPRMLFNRNLLYTAITRAKESVVILGSSDTIAEMAANQEENRRYTGLEKRICEVFDPSLETA